MMKSRWMVFSLAALALVGCAGMPRLMPAKKVAVPGDPLTTCPKADPCSKIANRKQYYDQRVARYYYFDTVTGHYFWENGERRFTGTDPKPDL